MNSLIVLRTLGMLLLCEAVAMFPSVVVALIYRENTIFAFIVSIAITTMIGLTLFSIRVKDKIIRYKEGFAIVTFGWLMVSVLGALPFLFTGAITSVIDAFFETVSGFSTTGATIINNIEVLPRSLLFWRSFTHWLGGMGILVLALALAPVLGVGTFQILKAESPGPISTKLTPRVNNTAKILYITYTVITAAEILLLVLGGMPLFDSFIHTFGTLGTGGFSIKNASVGAYNSVYFDIVITVFMIASGVNFSLYYIAFRRKSPAGFFKDVEFRTYISIIAVAITFITINLNGKVFDGVLQSLRHAAFQVASIITTTGFTTTDFDLWPDFSRAVLFVLMFVGACAGSTGGSVKVIRINLMFKYMKREVNRLIHPRAVTAVKIGNTPVQEEVLSGVMAFVMFYMIIFIVASLLLAVQGHDLVSSVAAVAATLGNIGPGFGMVGPATTYSALSGFSKLLLSFCMILGRLEIYTVIALLSPRFWKR
ncbi:MAG: potassium transporter TrkG [Bacillota bacterium]|nr:potassium transporter TrkG [Bacillota bacterium]MDD3298524.1 potassium transporter TrkG [Bacillota bacterium]MDD3850987.1 potassium transporter TrkG [Bacillota bacterium]MDD4708124.1 potassium transporter TrkG [Bacillota bacterium]